MIPSISTKQLTSSTSRNLFAQAPMEEKEKEDIGREKDRDWIPTLGGFLPNIKKDKADTAMIEVKTLQEYKDIVVDERDKLVVVHFYAPWCRSCKAVAPQLTKLRHLLGEHVKFVKVPVVSETMMIHQGLGVPSVPFGHIYHPDVGLVEEMKMSKKHFDDFANVLRHYVAGECKLPVDEERREEDFE